MNTDAASALPPREAMEFDVVVVGGKPIREPLAWAGPFVMNTKAEVLKLAGGGSARVQR